jgi:hypothetical protein
MAIFPCAVFRVAPKPDMPVFRGDDRGPRSHHPSPDRDRRVNGIPTTITVIWSGLPIGRIMRSENAPPDGPQWWWGAYLYCQPLPQSELRPVSYFAARANVLETFDGTSGSITMLTWR